MKRTPMSRGAAPLRRTALKPGKPSISAGGKPSKALRASERTYRQVRLEVLARDGYRCVLCARAATDTHHRQPRGMGGSARNAEIHSPANLVSLCREHHSHAESRRAWALGEGLLVRRGENPADIPVRVSHGNWVLLTAECTIIATRRRGPIAIPAISANSVTNDEDPR